jgi:predicted outer membrane repeat protein
MEVKCHISFLAAFWLLVLSVSTVDAVTYVDADAPAGGNGTSWATAYKYLCDALGPNREIWVAEGTYLPDHSNANPGGTGSRSDTFTLHSGCRIYGGFNGTETSLNQRDFRDNRTILSGDLNENDATAFLNHGDNSYHVVYGRASGNSSLLDGLTITGGAATATTGDNSYGGGMLSTQAVVKNCVFRLNLARYGGAYYGSGSLINCLFDNNRAYVAGYESDGGGAYLQNGMMTNCVFYGNQAVLGGGAFCWGDGVTITNCTFTDNLSTQAGNRGDALYISTYATDSANYSYVYNCIFWANRSSPDSIYVYSGTNSYAELGIDYCDIEGGPSSIETRGNVAVIYGTHNITSNPLLVNECRLAPGSPCLDAGDNSVVPTGITTDLDGNNRFCDDPVAPNTGSGTPPIVDMGAYECPSARCVIFVDDTATGADNGTSWTDAFVSLSDALAVAVPGSQIRVAAGLYVPDSAGLADSRKATFQLMNGVKICGGFPDGGGDETQRNPDLHVATLSGDLDGDDRSDYENYSDNCRHVVTGSGTDATAVLDGFTITSGSADDIPYPENSGGGMYNYEGSPSVNQCVFKYNFAEIRGGGVFNHGSTASFTNCDFIDNRVGASGGAVNNAYSANTTFVDCLFESNVSAEYGGAVQNVYSSDSVFEKCIFKGNYAGISGGAVRGFACSPTLINCILENNTAAQQGGAVWHNTSSHMKIWGCLLVNNRALEGGAYYSTSNCDPQIINSTFSRNSASVKGGAIQIQGVCNLTLRNSILWANDAPLAPQIGAGNGCTITAGFSDIQGGKQGILLENGGTISSYVNNLNADPLFVVAGYNFRLLGGSPCVDAGENGQVPAALTTDLDGQARKIDDPLTADTGSGSAPIVDMGGYEHGTWI